MTADININFNFPSVPYVEGDTVPVCIELNAGKPSASTNSDDSSSAKESPLPKVASATLVFSGINTALDTHSSHTSHHHQQPIPIIDGTAASAQASTIQISEDGRSVKIFGTLVIPGNLSPSISSSRLKISYWLKCTVQLQAQDNEQPLTLETESKELQILPRAVIQNFDSSRESEPFSEVLFNNPKIHAALLCDDLFRKSDIIA